MRRCEKHPRRLTVVRKFSGAEDVNLARRKAAKGGGAGAARGGLGIQRTGPRRVLKAVEKMMLHLTAYQAKNLEAMVLQAMEPLTDSLEEFSRRMRKLEKRVAWATRPNRRPPGRPPKRRGPGRPAKGRGPKGPAKGRGPGRPPKFAVAA